MTVINMCCIEGMRGMADHSVDAIVTDPPYELTQVRRTRPAPHVEGSPYSRHRVGVNGDTKPVGGFMGNEWDGSGVAFNVEMWVEALRVLKPGGHMLAFGGSRTYHRMVCAIEDAGFEVRDQIMWVYGSGFPKSMNVSKAIDEAKQWQGWGTALKPAHEPICVARKPLVGTVAANVLAHGTGAINVDGCRIAGVVTTNPQRRGAGNISTSGHAGQIDTGLDRVSDAGRWPANFIHDGLNEEWSRFFYCAKASKSDRGEGNTHPTVKPIDLMRYLCRLVTPPGGLVLDPFTGSGSTGKAALAEGFRFIGYELSAEYAAIARKRIGLLPALPPLPPLPIIDR